jgi:solute:Na+ symporter, SSS family
MNAAIALGIVAAVVAGTMLFGLRGVRGVVMDPQEYIVGGRRMGALLLWLLLAGEIYTTFTFLGAAGWAYGKGAPAYYILCYGTVAYVISFFLAPPIHRIARERGMLTGPDFFTDRYGSRRLGALVAVLGFLMLVPYVTLQLTGLQILLQIAGYGVINPFAAVAIGFFVVAIFTFVTGLRGAAFASIVKDALVLVGVLFAGLVLPTHFFGSPAGALDAVLRDHPTWLTIAGPNAPNGITWVVTTTILTACGFFMWPQSMAAIYSARDEDTLRRNAIFLPFYQVMLLLVFFAGFTALEVLPGLKGAAADQSFMLVVQKYYPPWVLGGVAAAGTLAALIPAAAQLLAAASIIGKNVFADYGLTRDAAAETRTTRILVLVVALLAFAFWALARTTLVGLLLIGYNGITQLFPGVVLGIMPRRPPAIAIGAGIVAGLIVLVYFAATQQSQVAGINTGLVALAVNAAVLGVVAAVARRGELGAVGDVGPSTSSG